MYAEVNSCGNPTTTDGKWDKWMGYNATGSTGIRWAPGRAAATSASGQYRPSANSMMNSLFGNNKNTSFNPVSREQIRSWHLALRQADRLDGAGGGAVTNPGVLKVNVIDPAVINVDWTVDGTMMTNGGHDVRHLDPGGREPHNQREGIRQRRRHAGAHDDLPELGHRRLLPFEELGQLRSNGQLDRDQTEDEGLKLSDDQLRKVRRRIALVVALALGFAGWMVVRSSRPVGGARG